MARKKPSKRFHYGYGRVEDVAGILIVFIMLVSGVLVATESVSRLFQPHEGSEKGVVGKRGRESFLRFTWLRVTMADQHDPALVRVLILNELFDLSLD